MGKISLYDLHFTVQVNALPTATINEDAVSLNFYFGRISSC